MISLKTTHEEAYSRLLQIRGDYVECNFWAEIDFISGYSTVRSVLLPRPIQREPFWSKEFASVTAAELNIGEYPLGLNAAWLVAVSKGLDSNSCDELMRLWTKHVSRSGNAPIETDLTLSRPKPARDDANSLPLILSRPRLFLSVPTLTSAVAYIFGRADADPEVGLDGCILNDPTFVAWIWSHSEQRLSAKWWRQILFHADWDDREAYRIFQDLTVRFFSADRGWEQKEAEKES